MRRVKGQGIYTLSSRQAHGNVRRDAGRERRLVDHVATCAANPLRFVETIFPWGKGDLGDAAGPDRWQRALLSDIGNHLATDTAPLRIAVASGHGVGKTALCAWLILWFLSTRDHPQCVVTANTQSQLRNKTWRELAKWQRLAENGHWFEWSTTRFALRQHSETWFASAVPWSQNRSESFAGTHDRHVCVIFDEASAIPDPIWEVTEGAMITPGAMWFAFGNPTRNSGRFRDCFRRFRHRWRQVTVDARDARQSNRRQIDDWIADYGEDSDFVRVRVRGIFPRAGFTQFIAEGEVEAATGRIPCESPHAPAILGVDVARFGDDASVLILRQGWEIRDIRAYRGLDLMQLAARVQELAGQFKPDAIHVDGAGIGAGVVDRLRALGLCPVDVNAGARALEPGRFANLRAEMWSKMRDWVRQGGALPADIRMLGDDLSGPEYSFDDQGRLRLERKDEMKSRGLASPDYGDALALTFAYPARPGSFDAARPRLAHNEYDPIGGS